jgi:aspartate aminotransferase-like enzyme
MGYGSRRENIVHCLRALGSVLSGAGKQVSGEEAVEAAEAVLQEPKVRSSPQPA